MAPPSRQSRLPQEEAFIPIRGADDRGQSTGLLLHAPTILVNLLRAVTIPFQSAAAIITGGDIL
jgi:hypothetical protein